MIPSAVRVWLTMMKLAGELGVKGALLEVSES